MQTPSEVYKDGSKPTHGKSGSIKKMMISLASASECSWIMLLFLCTAFNNGVLINAYLLYLTTEIFLAYYYNLM